MNGNGRFRVMAVFVALAIVVLEFAGPATDAAIAGTLPKDPCALITASEIQALAPNAKIGSGKLDTSGAPLGTGCIYSWGPRSDKWGDSELTITVIDASKAWVGVSPDSIALGVQMKVKTGGANASQISGVGDAAAFTYEEHSYNATAEAYLKGKDLHLALTFHHGDSLQSKDKLAALLKTAAGRL